MLRRGVQLVLAIVLGVATSQVWAEDWPQWRGPTGDHHAAPGATAPTTWSETEGLAWATPVPGAGHSSPTLVGNRIYLTTSDEQAQTQSLLIFDRQTGELLAEKLVHRGGLERGIHRNNTHASQTVASDGERVFAVFGNEAAAWVTAFDLDGNQLWQTRATSYAPQQYSFGYGTSPVVVGDKVIVTSVFDGPGSSMKAFDTRTGQERWSADRPQYLSYSPPARLPLSSGTQLLLSGNAQVTLYDADSGDQLWKTPAPWQATCGTMVWDEASGLGFASGGYPPNATLAVRLDGDHSVVWQNSVKCYESSLITHEGYLYGVSDEVGVAYCWRCADGQQMWKARLSGACSASLVEVGGNLYISTERGATHVFVATPERYTPIATNQLGDDTFATMTPADGRLYHRFAKTVDGRRQEYLAAIGP